MVVGVAVWEAVVLHNFFVLVVLASAARPRHSPEQHGKPTVTAYSGDNCTCFGKEGVETTRDTGRPIEYSYRTAKW